MKMSIILQKVFSRIEYWSSKTRINILKTIYINFRTLPFEQAIKFPIFIYGKVKLYNLSGRIVINGKITCGMIKLGYRQGSFSAPKRSAMILLAPSTRLIFNGPCMIDFDYCIRITGHGVLNLGAYIGFGSDTKFYCEDSITIGDYCRVPFGSCFMDTNYHYSINTVTGNVSRKSAPIYIGKYNWVGNTSTIMKGTRTPDGAIIASKSFLNKDYLMLGNGAKNIVLAGAPAKIVQENCTRILSLKIEEYVNTWFYNNKEKDMFNGKDVLKEYRECEEYNKLFD